MSCKEHLNPSPPVGFGPPYTVQAGSLWEVSGEGFLDTSVIRGCRVALCCQGEG